MCDPLCGSTPIITSIIWVLLSLVGTAASTPDSKDRHVPLVSHTTARPRQADTSLISQTMIGRHIESDPAGASRRYENPRHAYNDSIRVLFVSSLKERGLSSGVSPEASPTSWRVGLRSALADLRVVSVGGASPGVACWRPRQVPGVPVISAPRRGVGHGVFRQAVRWTTSPGRGVMTQPRSQPARDRNDSRGELEAADVAVAQPVVGERDDPAGDGDLGDLAVVAPLGEPLAALMQQ